MKHAILIIAYHNFDYVVNQINKYDRDFYIFIHWDKRNSLSKEQRNILENIDNVKYVGENIEVNWASYGIVRATYLLCEEAMKYSKIEYFHLISDADALIVNIKTFKDYYLKHKGKNFMSSSLLSFENGGGDKFIYYHRMEKYNVRANIADKIAYNEELRNQKENGIKKELPQCPLYHGSAWWSLTRECVNYLISKKDFVKKYFAEALFPDEMFAQTVIMNSKFASTVDNNKRYVSWELRNGNNPAILDRSDLVNILRNGCHFARKFDTTISGDLLDTIDTIVFQKYNNICMYQIEIINIINKCIKQCKISYKGLMYGNAGTLVFLSHCLKINITKDLISHNIIIKLRNLVISELKTVDDSSYHTGKLGLAITLEYIRCLGDNLEYDEETRNILSEINNSIINKVFNCKDKLSEYEKACYYIYFKSLEKGRNLDNLSSCAWELLNKYPTDINHQNIKVSESNNGLQGLAGIGLYKLSAKYGLPYDDWEFFYLI